MRTLQTLLRAAEEGELEVVDELADASDRKSLLEQQLQIILKVAVGETVILLHPPLPFCRSFNIDGEGMSVK